jgi:hypothetical protein
MIKLNILNLKNNGAIKIVQGFWRGLSKGDYNDLWDRNEENLLSNLILERVFMNFRLTNLNLF